MKIKSEKIDIVKIESIVENPRNRNIHSEKQIEMLAKIISIRGFRDPLVISKRSGFLISGHARLAAAKKIGMEELPVIFQDFDSEAEEHAHLIAVNEIARIAELDRVGFLEDVKELNLDLNDLDFELFGLLDFKLPELEEEKNYGDKNKEINVGEMSDGLDMECPKCNFRFASKK